MRPVVSSTVLRRPVARHCRSSPARFNSNVAPEGAQRKAQDTLGALSKHAERLWESAKTYMGPVGESVGKMLGSYRQPVMYKLSVTREVLKQIYIAEGLQPPTSLSTIQSAYATLWTRASSPAYWRQIASNGELGKVAIYAVEAYGIFKIGEIIGRRSLVGYNLH